MAAIVTGDWQEITINHPTLGNFTWYPKANEDSELDPGGLRVNDDDSQTDGGGRGIKQVNRVKWSWSGTVSWDMNIADELTQAKKLMADPNDADFTFTHVNGAVYKGKGSPVGDLKGNGNAGTFDIKIAGGGEADKIAG